MTSSGLRVRQAPRSQTNALIAWADRFDPDSCVIVDRLTSGTRKRRLWVAEDPSGDVAGLVLIDQVCLDRWMAYPLLEDPLAAEVLAPVVDASPAWGMEGMTRHMGPFMGRLERAMGEPAARSFVYSDAQVLASTGLDGLLDEMLGPLDDRTRLAGPRDLGALVRLYDGYEMQRVPTRRRLRVYLAETLSRLPVIVAEVDGRLVGALRAEAMSPHTIVWDDHTVLPEYRGQKLSLAISRRCAEVARALGRGTAATVQPSNPWRIPAAEDLPGWLNYDPGDRVSLFLRLSPPVRFRGQHRLRHVVETLEGRRARRPL